MPQIETPIGIRARSCLVNSGGGYSTGAEKITKSVTDVISQAPGVVETLAGINLPELLQKVPPLNGKAGKKDK